VTPGIAGRNPSRPPEQTGEQRTGTCSASGFDRGENAPRVLLIVDWSIRGTGPDGHEINLEGTASDIARRGADGKWRYAIDNPFGTSG